LWNGSAGHSWVAAQELLDGMLEPFERLLVAVAVAEPRQAVLDVGCGTGATTVALAKRLGSAAVVGVDLSQPMLEHARLRAQREGSAATFVCGDAEVHPFEPASFDLIVSRFGVMFFDDTVGAFGNLRRAARADAELFAIAWRSASENPFMTAAERAAAPLLPALPARDPDGPGQFRFADANGVVRTLEQSGWTEIELRPLDVECSFPAADLERYLTRLGPLGRALNDVDDATKERVLAVVRSAFDAYVHGDQVRFNAACWAIAARAPRA
jgi:SAM-dependent methyltransferase